MRAICSHRADVTVKPTRRFFVRDIEILCSIGIYDHEREHKQRVIVNIEVVLDPDSEPTSDAILEGLDYDMIRDGVIELATERHYDRKKRWHAPF